MPTVHLSQPVVDKIDDLHVRLITESQTKIKRSTIIELALMKGIDNVTFDDVVAFETKQRCT